MNTEKNEIILLTEQIMKEKIYTIRGIEVMLDFDLAQIYGYTTKSFNQQVKRNGDKFPEDFMFQLNKKELPANCLKSQFVTLNESGNQRGIHIKKLPYAFTEQGIYMLMTVLKGPLAVQQSRTLIRMFKKMKDTIIENQEFVSNKDFLRFSLQVTSNSKEIDSIKKQMATQEDFQEIMAHFIDPNTYKHFLIMNGEKIEAYAAYTAIYKLARQSLYIVDNYVELKSLEVIREIDPNVNVILFTDNNSNQSKLTSSIVNDFCNEYPMIQIHFQKTDGKFHDRYIAVDYDTENEMIFHCGASSKDAGKRITAIFRIEDTQIYHPLFDELLKNPKLTI